MAGKACQAAESQFGVVRYLTTNTFGVVVGVVITGGIGHENSRKDVLHHMPMHIGEAAVHAVGADGELFVIDA